MMEDVITEKACCKNCKRLDQKTYVCYWTYLKIPKEKLLTHFCDEWIHILSRKICKERKLSS